MIHTDLYACIKDLASGNVFIGAAPEETKAPYIIWNVISTQFDETYCGSDGARQSNVQIDCYDKTILSAVTLREQVLTAISSLVPGDISCEESLDPDTTLGRSMIDCMIWL